MHYDPSKALSRVDNNAVLFSAMISTFIEDCPNYAADLQAACNQLDLNTLGDTAFTVKKASAAIGLVQVEKLAEDLEVHCRQLGVQTIAIFEKSTASLIEELNKCRLPLEQWISKAA